MSNQIWAIDPTHSEVQFKVKHLVISTVTGRFKSFNASLEQVSDSFEGATANFDADVKSISTNNKDRDNHLKSEDFFNAEKFEKLKFSDLKFHKTSGDDFKLSGKLTIKDVTKEIELNATLGGIVEDPYGNTKAGFEVTGKINRKDFGLTWSAVTEAGKIVVGDEIKLQADLQFVKK